MKSEESLSVSEPAAFLVTGSAFMYVLRISIARRCDETAGVGVTSAAPSTVSAVVFVVPIRGGSGWDAYPLCMSNIHIELWFTRN